MAEPATSTPSQHAWQQPDYSGRGRPPALVILLLVLLLALLMMVMVLLGQVHALRQDVVQVGSGPQPSGDETTTVVGDPDTCRLLGALLARQGVAPATVFSGQQDMSECETAALEGAQSASR